MNTSESPIILEEYIPRGVNLHSWQRKALKAYAEGQPLVIPTDRGSGRTVLLDVVAKLEAARGRETMVISVEGSAAPLRPIEFPEQPLMLFVGTNRQRLEFVALQELDATRVRHADMPGVLVGEKGPVHLIWGSESDYELTPIARHNVESARFSNRIVEGDVQEVILS